MEQFKTVINKYTEEPKNENRKKCYSFDITSTNQYFKDRMFIFIISYSKIKAVYFIRINYLSISHNKLIR